MFKRVLMYSHDSYGLGHFRRNLTIAEYLLAHQPGMTVLSVAGNPRSHQFHLPERFDYVKLPAATKDSSGSYVSRELDLDFPRLISMRSRLIQDCVAHFDPDLFLVDHVPNGLGGEILPVLKHLRTRKTKVVFGMRDIIDNPEKVRNAWKKEDNVQILRDYYDALFLYGDTQVFNPILSYGLPADLMERMFVTGYVVRNGSSPASTNGWSPKKYEGRRLVVVTAGGGGDGYPLMKTYLDGLKKISTDWGLASLLVTGPLMSRKEMAGVREAAEGLPNVDVVEFIQDIHKYYRQASLVLSLGGYNSVAEILNSGAPALIVPRVFPRQEQLIRAEALAARGLIECLHPEHLNARELMRRILSRLLRGKPRESGNFPRLDGLAGTWNALQALAAGKGPVGLQVVSPAQMTAAAGGDSYADR